MAIKNESVLSKESFDSQPGAAVIVFDEATSALDSKTELLLMQSIKESIKDITMISIAHRHSTLKDFDKIISIKNGSVVSFLDPEDIL